MTNQSPTELWANLSTTPRPWRSVPFPRKRPDGEPLGSVKMVVLTPQETAQASVATEAATKALCGPVRKDEAHNAYATTYDNVLASELLYLACRDEGDFDRKIFPSGAAIRAHLSVDEVACLMNAYAETQSELSPIVSIMSKEEMDAILEKLEKGGSVSNPFSSLSPAMQTTLLRYSVSRWRDLLTDSSFAGTLRDEPQTSATGE